MQIKTFEIRDRGTFLPVVAIRIQGGAHHDTSENDADRYLIGRAGYGDHPCILLAALDGGTKAHFDPWGWSDQRTMATAHNHIIDHWGDLESGAVVDVQFILGETTAPKVSERVTS